MLTRVFFFLLGFGLTILGFIYIISYLNLLSLGYNFLDYVNFIIRRIECLNAFIGIIIMLMSIGGRNELYI